MPLVKSIVLLVPLFPITTTPSVKLLKDIPLTERVVPLKVMFELPAGILDASL